MKSQIYVLAVGNEVDVKTNVVDKSKQAKKSKEESEKKKNGKNERTKYVNFMI